MTFKIINRVTKRSWDGNTVVTVEAQDENKTVFDVKHSNMLKLASVKGMIEKEYKKIIDIENVELLNIGDIF